MQPTKKVHTKVLRTIRNCLENRAILKICLEKVGNGKEGSRSVRLRPTPLYCSSCLESNLRISMHDSIQRKVCLVRRIDTTVRFPQLGKGGIPIVQVCVWFMRWRSCLESPSQRGAMNDENTKQSNFRGPTSSQTTSHFDRNGCGCICWL